MRDSLIRICLTNLALSVDSGANVSSIFTVGAEGFLDCSPFLLNHVKFLMYPDLHIPLI